MCFYHEHKLKKKRLPTFAYLVEPTTYRTNNLLIASKICTVPDLTKLFYLSCFAALQNTYVDPFFLRMMPPTFACETKPDYVITSSVIGCGEFGKVYQGTLIKKGNAQLLIDFFLLLDIHH